MSINVQAENANLNFFEIKNPQLSDYLDYRKYLNDYYEYRKEQTRGQIRPYSYGMFSAAADIKSPNYLKMIIDGKRNLSEDMIYKFAKALQLSKEQAEEFRILVQFTQASEPAIRNQYLRELSEYRVQVKLKNGELDKKAFDKIPNWIGWILFSMIDQDGVTFDITELRRLLRGKATEDEIREALSTLMESGEIVRDELKGEFRRGRNLVENPEEIPVALIRKLQGQLMYLGLESLFQDPPTDREFGTLTLCLNRAEFEELKFQLRKIRKQAHKDYSIKRMASKGERVYQLNLQLFPVTDEKVSKDSHILKPRSIESEA